MAEAAAALASVQAVQGASSVAGDVKSLVYNVRDGDSLPDGLAFDKTKASDVLERMKDAGVSVLLQQSATILIWSRVVGVFEDFFAYEAMAKEAMSKNINDEGSKRAQELHCMAKQLSWAAPVATEAAKRVSRRVVLLGTTSFKEADAGLEFITLHNCLCVELLAHLRVFIMEAREEGDGEKKSSWFRRVRRVLRDQGDETNGGLQYTLTDLATAETNPELQSAMSALLTGHPETMKHIDILCDHICVLVKDDSLWGKAFTALRDWELELALTYVRKLRDPCSERNADAKVQIKSHASVCIDSISFYFEQLQRPTV